MYVCCLDNPLPSSLTLAELMCRALPSNTGHMVIELTAQVADSSRHIVTDVGLRNNIESLLEDGQGQRRGVGDSLLLTVASKGGLALLAEHLPLLYPAVTNVLVTSVTRKDVTPPSSTPNPADYWVNLEAVDDVYEVRFYCCKDCLVLLVDCICRKCLIG